ncbi:MAG: SMP-30/gluconolactonase/LRE family protein [Bacteroidetes bacterium]|nr:SMP-30/gluconolactonase/LRE family protein [Bacteroidota bacterium]
MTRGCLKRSVVILNKVPACYGNATSNGGQDGFAFFDIGTGNSEKNTDPESHLPNNRFNDGKCSPNGEFWTGTLAYDLKEGAGSLYSLNAGLTVEVKIPSYPQ